MLGRNLVVRLALSAGLIVGVISLMGCGGGGSSFSGTVVVDDASSTPAPDARVVVGGVLTQSDAAGKFAASGPATNADGEVFVTVSKVGYRTSDGTFKPSDSPQIRLAVRALADYGAVTGQVLDATTDQGIGLVELEVQPIFGGEVSSQTDIQFAHTASDGSFVLTGFLGGSGLIIARANGYMTQRVPISIEVGDPPPKAHPYTISLTPTTERVDVTGTVTDLETGGPLAGVTTNLGDVSATTHSDGSFTIVGIVVGTRTVTATLEGYDPYAASVTIESGMAPLRIALSRSTPPPTAPANVKGTVTLQGQQSNAGATVAALDGSGHPVDSATTDAAGAYGLLLPAGSYQLHVSASGFAPQQRAVSVPGTGQVLTGIDFTLGP